MGATLIGYWFPENNQILRYLLNINRDGANLTGGGRAGENILKGGCHSEDALPTETHQI